MYVFDFDDDLIVVLVVMDAGGEVVGGRLVASMGVPNGIVVVGLNVDGDALLD